jgi:ribonuclease P protein component
VATLPVVSSFGKSLRLLNAYDYKSVFDDAKIKLSKKEILILARPNGTHSPRLGLVIAKKSVKQAVQRNRIKRLARESFRMQQSQLQGVDAIVLARRGLDQLDNSDLRSLFDRLWLQLATKREKHAAKP